MDKFKIDAIKNILTKWNKTLRGKRLLNLGEGQIMHANFFISFAKLEILLEMNLHDRFLAACLMIKQKLF